MKFIYGKHDFHSMERGQENCYLLTNGLGGFSSCTMIGSNSRNDHALLMASYKAPNLRYNMVNRLSETLKVGLESSPHMPAAEGVHSFWISSQQFVEGEEENGYLQQTSFSFEDYPQWRYQAAGVELTKTIGMAQDSNTAAVVYEIKNMGNKACTFSVTPFFQFVRKGEELNRNQEFCLKWEPSPRLNSTEGVGELRSGALSVYFASDGEVKAVDPAYEDAYYAYDACDGRRDHGKSLANHVILKTVPQGCTGHLELLYSTEKGVVESGITAVQIVENTKTYRQALAQTAGFHTPAAVLLSKSAGQFVSRRESGKVSLSSACGKRTKGKTILAGYPFFEDWGRDTMIALPGCVLATGQYDTAKSILRTFIANEKKGLMPNLFPEVESPHRCAQGNIGGEAGSADCVEPAYNTVDAALLFINCVYLYYKKTGDLDFVHEAYPVMADIVLWYRKGTEYGIHMEEDGLLMAGQGMDQVTWMDVRVGDILPTPRHGKPVEINAYWYNAICIMKELTDSAEPTVCQTQVRGTLLSSGYEELADRIRTSFCREFWMEDKQCLKDLVSGTKADTQIRCNQIWAISLPFTMLSRKHEKQVVKTVFEKLYTPYGLRTLAPEDEEFHGFYGGTQLDRDLAYHQGTVWPFPLGAYYLAYLKVCEDKKAAADTVMKQLEVMECALREGCVGQLPEIYDGANPSSSKGCFAQAWSVGEILRVYEAMEQCER